MTQAIKSFRSWGKVENAEKQANKWLVENPKVKVVSFKTREGFFDHCDDYTRVVEMVIDFDGGGNNE